MAEVMDMPGVVRVERSAYTLEQTLSAPKNTCFWCKHWINRRPASEGTFRGFCDMTYSGAHPKFMAEASLANACPTTEPGHTAVLFTHQNFACNQFTKKEDQGDG